LKAKKSAVYVKYVDIAIIHFLTAVAIAAWVSDDGTARNGSTAFCTDSFSDGCLDILIHAMMLNHGINLVKYTHMSKYNRLQVARADMPKFNKLIREHLHPSMMHKLGDWKDVKA
jgi:hypothetical protein